VTKTGPILTFLKKHPLYMTILGPKSDKKQKIFLENYFLLYFKISKIKLANLFFTLKKK
jgi:hypothetical protein